MVRIFCPECGIVIPRKPGKKCRCGWVVEALAYNESYGSPPPDGPLVGVVCDGCLKLFQALAGCPVRCPKCGLRNQAPSLEEVQQQPKSQPTWEEEAKAATLPPAPQPARAWTPPKPTPYQEPLSDTVGEVLSVASVAFFVVAGVAMVLAIFGLAFMKAPTAEAATLTVIAFIAFIVGFLKATTSWQLSIRW